MLLCVNNCRYTGKDRKVYRNLAIIEQKSYSYLTHFKNIAFLRTTTKGPPPRCLPQGPHHPRSTPGCCVDVVLIIVLFACVIFQHG